MMRWGQRVMLPLVVIMLVAQLVRWGGTARPGPLFVVGVVVLIGLVLGWGGLLWWLLWSPLAAPVPKQPQPQLRQFVVLLSVMSGNLFIIGAMWDEIWHRRFGALQDDFLWAPHLTIYASLALITLFGGGALWMVLRGPGSVRVRFRTEPLIGLLALVAAFLLASLPSDELWHRIYAKDLTAWSLPHLIIVAGVVAIMGVAAIMQLSLLPQPGWRSLRGLTPREWLLVWAFVPAFIQTMQVGVLEWDHLDPRILELRQPGSTSPFYQAFLGRPEWLYPVVLVTISTFFGTTALWSIQRAGVATLLGGLVLLLRAAASLSATSFWPDYELPLYSYVFILFPLLALDLWYWWGFKHLSQRWLSLGGSVAGAGALLVGALPLIAVLMPYPRINGATLPWMIGMTVLLAGAVGWAAAQLGRWMRHTGVPVAVAATTISGRWKVAAYTMCTTILGVLLLIILSATPPA